MRAMLSQILLSIRLDASAHGADSIPPANRHNLCVSGPGRAEPGPDMAQLKVAALVIGDTPLHI